MHMGLQVSYFSWPGAPASIGPTFAAIAGNADRAGMSSLWVMDHFFQISMIGPPELDMLEAYTTLGFAAACTERIELGTMVTGITYRHPGLLAKTVTTLDVLSGGRAWCGVGAAWNEEEHLGLGVPFPPLAERFERLEETLQICRQMWDGDESPYRGSYYTLERPLNSPQSVSRPRPKVLIGGGGEKKTLRLVAKYADGCNIFDMGPQGVAHKFDVLRGHCDRVGRDDAEIYKTVLSRVTLGDGSAHASGEPTSSVGQVVDKLGRLAAVGADEVIVGMANADDPDVYHLVAEVVRQITPIVPAGR